MLGGRAWRFKMFPLTSHELGEVDLLRALNNGLMPSHYPEKRAHRAYNDRDYDIRFWRTKSGLEVDFVLGDGELAVEVKSSSRVDRNDFRGIKAFNSEHHTRMAIIVCNESTPRVHDGVHVLPWTVFLKRLWADELI